MARKTIPPFMADALDDVIETAIRAYIESGFTVDECVDTISKQYGIGKRIARTKVSNVCVKMLREKRN